MLFLINGFVISGIVLGSLLIVILTISFICYRMAFYNERKTNNFYFPKGEEYQKFKPFMKELVKNQELIPCEDIYIKSKDKKRLYGRYYHVEDNSILEIQFHGYKGTGIRDFCGGNKLSREFKHNSILVDQRGHGKSSGSTISFGIKEKYDVLEWVNYAISRFGNDVKIILCGVSMGASTILMASELDLPKNVIAIIADCPYSSPREILKKVIEEDMKLPYKLCFPFLFLGALFFGGFILEKNGPKNACKNAKVPFCLIHGKNDTFVPPIMSEEIIKNTDKINELHLFDGAEHGISYIVNPDKYAKIVSDFIGKIIKVKDNGII